MSSTNLWKKLYSTETKGQAPQAQISPEGIPIHPLYTEDDLKRRHVDQRLSLPGTPPFTRGVRASMYTGRKWTIRQYAGFSTAEESNIFYKKCITINNCTINKQEGQLKKELTKKILAKATIYQKQNKDKNFKPYNNQSTPGD